MIEFLKRPTKPDLAYSKFNGKADLPTIMFLGGFKSDMMGSKASFLDQQCRTRQQSYIRFDYSGHGQSEGKFEQGCISDWTQDARDVLNQCIENGPVILVGSSMGGWISLLLALSQPERIQVLIGVAAAPDFTSWMEEGMNNEQRTALETDGFFKLPSDYGEPYIITKKLLEDGRKNLLLKSPININIPVRLLQGKQDKDVPWETAERIKEKITSDDVDILYREAGNHSLSAPGDLTVLDNIITKLSGL